VGAKKKELFRFKDPKIKSASGDMLEAKSERFGQISARTKQSCYRNKPVKVKPMTENYFGQSMFILDS